MPLKPKQRGIYKLPSILVWGEVNWECRIALRCYECQGWIGFEGTEKPFAPPGTMDRVEILRYRYLKGIPLWNFSYSQHLERKCEKLFNGRWLSWMAAYDFKMKQAATALKRRRRDGQSCEEEKGTGSQLPELPLAQSGRKR